MDISDSIRVGEEVAKTVDIFDFVVNSAVGEETGDVGGCRSFKSLGIYLESSSIEGNNNAASMLQCNDDNNNTTGMVAASCNVSAAEKPVDVDKCNEQNNNHLLVTSNGLGEYVQGSSGQYYWASGTTAKEQIRWDQSMLEELNCWSQDNGPEAGAVAERDAPQDDNTDGAIYTLTVLNGGSSGDSSWYRLATESDNRTSTIDIDSLLNNLLPANGHSTQHEQSPPDDVTCLQLPYQQDTTLPPTKPQSNAAKLHPPTAQFVFHDSTFHQEPEPEIPNPFNSTLKSSSNSNECDDNHRHNKTDCISNKTSNSNSQGPNSNSRCNNDSINNYNNSTSSNNDDGGGSSEWKYLTNGSEARVNSLLRNALQGKSVVGSFTTSRYSGTATVAQKQSREDGSVPLAMTCVSLDGCLGVTEDRTSGSAAPSTHHMDDLFLSQLDVSSVGYGDDYDKLKSIEHEVATSVEQYCTSAVACDYFAVGATSSRVAPHSVKLTTSSTGKNSSKKYSSKRCSPASKTETISVSSQSHRTSVQSPAHGSGARKERSLHYCTICHKGFKDKYSVNVHVRTHTGEKPFACAFCGKNFRQKAHLAKHHHTHSAHKSSPTPQPSNKPHPPPNPNPDSDKQQR